MTRPALLLLLLAAWASCRGTAGENEEDEAAASTRVDADGRVVLSPAEIDALDLRTAVVVRETLTASALRYGRASVRPEEQALVVAPFTGRLSAPPAVSLGTTVKEGDALVSVEIVVDTASRAGMAAQRRELQGQVDGARARVRAFESERSRVASLVESNLATDADLARAQADLESEQARLEGLKRANSELAVVTGGALVIRAPVAGVVVALESEVGELVQPGQTLARIVQPGPRWIDVAVAPSEPVGTGYRVRVDSGWHDARLLARGAVVGPDGVRLDRVELGADASSSVLPGATVAVEVLRASEGTVVPVDAVIMRGTQPAVFIEADAGKFVIRDVTLGARADDRVLVSGIEPGQRVVVRGTPSLLGEIGSTTAADADAPPPAAETP